MKQLDAQLQVSQVLPHIQMPIGDESTPQATLLALADSGAGLNLGCLDCHQDVYEKHPHLVHQFAYLKDLDDMSPFGIGGIGADSQGPQVVALITFKMPFRVNGTSVYFTMALGEEVATNSILAFPFFKATKSIIMLGEDTIVGGLLGVSFQMEYMVPPRAASAPMVAQEASVTFITGAITPTCTPLSADIRTALDMLSSVLNITQSQAVDFTAGFVVSIFAVFATRLESYLPAYAKALPDLEGIICHRATKAVFMVDLEHNEYNETESDQ
jgi:hypothetical protein